MYLEQYSLDRFPFSNDTDTSLFFDGGGRGFALDAMVDAILSGPGIWKVIGPGGSGKSLLCGMLAERLTEEMIPIRLPHPNILPEEVHALLDRGLGLEELPNPGKATRRLKERLGGIWAEEESAGEEWVDTQEALDASPLKPVVILIDNAHDMPLTSLEEIALLGDKGWENKNGLRVVLLGRSPLDELLGSSRTGHFVDKLSGFFHLSPLAKEETERYIHHRLTKTGRKEPGPFTPGAIHEMHAASAGRLRELNRLAHMALLKGYRERVTEIEGWHVLGAIREGEEALAVVAPKATSDQLGETSDSRGDSKEELPQHPHPRKRSLRVLSRGRRIDPSEMWRPAVALAATSGLALLIGSGLLSPGWEKIVESTPEPKPAIASPAKPEFEHLNQTRVAFQRAMKSKGSDPATSGYHSGQEIEVMDVSPRPVLAGILAGSAETKAETATKKTLSTDSHNTPVVTMASSGSFGDHGSWDGKNSDPRTTLVASIQALPEPHPLKRITETAPMGEAVKSTSSQKASQKASQKTTKLALHTATQKAIQTAIGHEPVRVRKASHASVKPGQSGPLNGSILAKRESASRAWLENSNGSHYSIQLMIVRKQAAEKLDTSSISDQNAFDGDDLHLFPLEDDRYLIFLGDFSSYKAAKASIAQLSPKLRQAGPYVLPVRDIRVKINRLSPPTSHLAQGLAKEAGQS
ncbi:MAG: AAA family ATPase [Magnetococcales bacterium]|nr:AAA family ATPase [Magnetococcales bacterium]